MTRIERRGLARRAPVIEWAIPRSSLTYIPHGMNQKLCSSSVDEKRLLAALEVRVFLAEECQDVLKFFQVVFIGFAEIFVCLKNGRLIGITGAGIVQPREFDVTIGQAFSNGQYTVQAEVFNELSVLLIEPHQQELTRFGMLVEGERSPGKDTQKGTVDAGAVGEIDNDPARAMFENLAKEIADWVAIGVVGLAVDFENCRIAVRINKVNRLGYIRHARE